MSVRKWAVRHPGIGVLHYDSEQEAVVAAGTAGELLGQVDVTPANVGLLRWEDPPTSRSHPGRPRGSNGAWEAVAEELRRNPGRWAVVYDGPKTAASGLSTHIGTGGLAPFTPSGDFDACSRVFEGRRVVYARYVGDGEV